jgi:hypothetical protein
MNPLFVLPPSIDPVEYLGEAGARKLAGVKITSPASAWPDEITQTLLREHPYIPSDRIVVNLKKKDETTGSAFGYVGIVGAPKISIPVIMQNRELKPLDVMIFRTSDGSTTQAVGDMEDDKVLPLSEESFSHALDTGDAGESVPDNRLRGFAYSEDGSNLRLPYRGRTVMASVMGITDVQKAALEAAITKEAAAGFLLNRTDSVVNEWLAAPAPKQLVQTKLASAPAQRAVARTLQALPSETDKFASGKIVMEDDTYKTAASLSVIDLRNPEKGMAPVLIYADGSYGSQPSKVAFVPCGDGDVEQIYQKIMSDGVLARGDTVMLEFPEGFSAPMKVASLAVHDESGTIVAKLSDGLFLLPIVFQRGVKTASYDEGSSSWLVPLDTKVLRLGDMSTLTPASTDKVAKALQKAIPDTLICADGQFSLTVNGDSFGVVQASEAKCAAVLDQWFENGEALLQMAKERGHVRFACDLPEAAMKIAAQVAELADYPKVAAAAVKKIAIPLDKAVKLAAAIGDPEGVDAMLGAGFLTEDNLSEFASLGDQFEDTTSKLARLLLAVRMGFPGDENATAVAMKSLQRVTEGLNSAIQEVQ